MKEFNTRRKLIVDGLRSLKGVECSLPGGSFFVFPNVKGTGMNGEQFTEKCLKEAGVAMIPGTAFGKFAVDNVRFNFATSRENISKAIEDILKDMKNKKELIDKRMKSIDEQENDYSKKIESIREEVMKKIQG